MAVPRFLPSIIAGSLAAILGAFAVWMFTRLAGEPEAAFNAPGEYTFNAPKAGNYTVWHQSTASIEGVYTVRDPRLPVGTTIVVRHNGEFVPTKVDGSNRVSGEEHGDKTSVLTFTAPEAGEYLIDISGLTETRAFTVTTSLTAQVIFTAMACAFGAMGAGALAVVLVVMALAGIYPKRVDTPPVLAAQKT